MGGIFGGGPKPPKAPDPNKVAAAQSNYSNPNVTGPLGSSAFSMGADGRLNQNITLNPQLQSGLDNSLSNLNSLSGRDQSFFSNLQVPGAPQYQQQVAGAGPIQSSLGNAGPIQQSLDTSSLSALPGINDFSADRQKAEDATFANYQRTLDPQFELRQRQLDTTLANRGITAGSEAYNRELDQFNRAQTDAYGQARRDAFTQGGQEQSRLFGLGLAGRQQGFGELQGMGQFANSAQNQQFGQNLQGGQFANQAQNQLFGQNLQGGQFANNAAQQGFADQNQQLAQALAIRNAPVAEQAQLQALLQGYMPNFQGAGNVDISGAMQNQYAGQLNAYNQQQANKQAGIGALAGIAASVGGGIAGGPAGAAAGNAIARRLF